MREFFSLVPQHDDSILSALFTNNDPSLIGRAERIHFQRNTYTRSLEPDEKTPPANPQLHLTGVCINQVFDTSSPAGPASHQLAAEIRKPAKPPIYPLSPLEASQGVLDRITLC